MNDRDEIFLLTPHKLMWVEYNRLSKSSTLFEMFKNAENGQILLALNTHHNFGHFFENAAIQRLIEIIQVLLNILAAAVG